MNTAGNAEPLIKNISVTNEAIIADLADGRSVTVPLAWSWRLSEATPLERNNFEIIGAGQGVRWPKIDEDLSAEGLLGGVPARRRKLTTDN